VTTDRKSLNFSNSAAFLFNPANTFGKNLFYYHTDSRQTRKMRKIRMKTILKILATALLCSSFVSAQPALNPPAANDTAMKTVTSGKFIFSYKVDGQKLVAKLTCPSTGWVAVGFNPKSVMKGAGFIIGAVVDGKPVISEEFGTGMFEHKPIAGLGGKNVLVAGDCTLENETATLSFTMPLSTKDGMHPDLAAGKKVRLIFATGGSGDMTKKHKTKGSKTITL
jgi:hypothetical protein